LAFDERDAFPSYYRYWGKADRDDPLNKYHLLPYHCLDVAAVAAVWWEKSPIIQKAFCASHGLNQEKIRGWVLFFIALHDIGKFDIRFQRKVVGIWKKLQCPIRPSRLSADDSRYYFHGPAGLYWMNHELEEFISGGKHCVSSAGEDVYDFDWDYDENEFYTIKSRQSWLEAVTGHHGHIVKAENNSQFPLPSDCPEQYTAFDKDARKNWIMQLEEMFLKPAGLSLEETPPLLTSSSFMAGFCSVADWLGSANSEEHFCYTQEPIDLKCYFKQKLNDAHKVLKISGLIGKSKSYEGIQRLLKNEHRPHQVQTIIDELSCPFGKRA